MRKTWLQSQVPENGANIVAIKDLTENSKINYILPVIKPKARKRIPKKVAFEPDGEERNIIEAVQEKHGIHKATDVLRMALRRLKESDQLGLKAG